MEKHHLAELLSEKSLSKREKVLMDLKQLAKSNWAAEELLIIVKEDIGEMFLENPDIATKYNINKYNKLVMSSMIPYSERKKLLLE